MVAIDQTAVKRRRVLDGAVISVAKPAEHPLEGLGGDPLEEM